MRSTFVFRYYAADAYLPDIIINLCTSFVDIIILKLIIKLLFFVYRSIGQILVKSFLLTCNEILPKNFLIFSIVMQNSKFHCYSIFSTLFFKYLDEYYSFIPQYIFKKILGVMKKIDDEHKTFVSFFFVNTLDYFRNIQKLLELFGKTSFRIKENF